MNKETSPIKKGIVNITSIQFEQMAIEAAEKNGIKKLDCLSTSFNRYKSFDEEYSKDKVQTVFYVAYTIAGEIFVGQSTHPQIAIEEAINNRNQQADKTTVNSQAKIEHEQPETKTTE